MTGRELMQLFPNPSESGLFFAHQGGWDEILLVVGPLGVIAFLLWTANKRVADKLAEQEALDSEQTQQESETDKTSQS